MPKVFVMGGGYAGKSIRLMNRYNFVDGVHLEEDDDTAKLKASVLCKFYPCEMLDHQDYVARQAKPAPAKPATNAQTTPPPGIVPTQSVSTMTAKAKDSV